MNGQLWAASASWAVCFQWCWVSLRYVNVSAYAPSFLLTPAGQLLLYTGIAGGSSLKAKLFQCWRLPERINNLVCCSSSCSRPLFLKPSQFISGNLALQVFLSLAGGSILSLFLLVLLHCYYYLPVLGVPLFLSGLKYVGTGSSVCAAVAVPADAAPGHCPSDSSAVWSLSQPSANPGLSNPGEFQTEFTRALPCNERFVRKLRGGLSAARNCKKKTCFWSTHYTPWPVPLSAPKTC